MPPSPAQVISQLINNRSLNQRAAKKLGVAEIRLDQGKPQDDMITFEETYEGSGVYAQAIHIPDQWMRIANANNAQEFIDWLRRQ